MIDILLSTYNGEKFLKEQLDSLLQQTYQNYKIIIRDDGSKDTTIEILNTYKEKYIEKILLIDGHGRNLGSTNSFFELLHHSDSELVMFCDQDDVWYKDKLKTFFDFYTNHCSNKQLPILIHSAAEVVNENLDLMKEETRCFNIIKCGMEKDLKWQIFQNDVTGCTTMINSVMRDLVKNIDFTKNRVIQHDWFFSLIAYLNSTKFYYSEPTIKYRQHSNNVISAKRISLIQRIKRKLKFGFVYPYYEQIKTVLQCHFSVDNKQICILEEFSNLQNKKKIYRVFWHIKHNFFRKGNLFYRIYQLLAC